MALLFEGGNLEKPLIIGKIQVPGPPVCEPGIRKERVEAELDAEHATEAEASAKDVAALITQIRDAGIAAVFVENIADRRLLDQIAAETGAAIGGTLYSDALSGPEGPAATYLDMMRHNLGQLTAALTN